jgi:hypothetical protein
MHRLNPTGLFLLGLNLITPRDIEQSRGAVTQQSDEALARRTVFRDDVVRIRP